LGSWRSRWSITILDGMIKLSYQMIEHLELNFSCRKCVMIKKWHCTIDDTVMPLKIVITPHLKEAFTKSGYVSSSQYHGFTKRPSLNLLNRSEFIRQVIAKMLYILQAKDMVRSSRMYFIACHWSLRCIIRLKSW